MTSTSLGRLAALAALALACPPSPAAADTYPRQPGVDIVHYVFRLEVLTNTTGEIRGTATVHVKFLAPGVDQVVLDLVSPADGKGMTVVAVTRDDAPVKFAHDKDRLHLSLPEPPGAGRTVPFTIEYRGVPADGLRLIPNMHGHPTAFSQNWPNRARHWLPMIDHPYDKAGGEFLVTAPADYQVVANGRLVEEIDLGGGRRQTHWSQEAPIASWLYTLGIARFAVRHAPPVRGVPLQSWVFPENRDTGYALFEATSRRAIEFFSERVAPYPYDKLANVQAAGVGGGMEHATAIFYGDKGVAAGRAPVVHEIAHQWWGNAVTERDWDDVWLSEGFATYFTHLFAEHYDGRDAFVTGLLRDIETVVQAGRKMPDTPIVHRNLDDMRQVLNRFVYQKGGWVLHMLRRSLGDETFWAALRTYYRRHEHRNASTDDFRQVVEEVSGSDLGWFFRQWLNRPGIPRIEGAWHYDAAGKRVEVDLVQVQEGEAFRLPIEIGITAGAESRARVERVEMTEGRARFTFPADEEPSAVTLDPGTWLLMERGPFARRDTVR